MPRDAIVETLLNTLEAERYVRGPLLNTLVDELVNLPGNERAAVAARETLEVLEHGDLAPGEFNHRLAVIRGLVRAHAMPRASAA